MIIVPRDVNGGHRHAHVERIADSDGGKRGVGGDGLAIGNGRLGAGGMVQGGVSQRCVNGFFGDHTFVNGDDIVAARGVKPDIAVAMLAFANGELDVISIIKWVGAGLAWQHGRSVKFADMLKLLFDKLGFVSQLRLVAEMLQMAAAACAEMFAWRDDTGRVGAQPIDDFAACPVAFDMPNFDFDALARQP